MLLLAWLAPLSGVRRPSPLGRRSSEKSSIGLWTVWRRTRLCVLHSMPRSWQRLQGRVLPHFNLERTHASQARMARSDARSEVDFALPDLFECDAWWRRSKSLRGSQRVSVSRVGLCTPPVEGARAFGAFEAAFIAVWKTRVSQWEGLRVARIHGGTHASRGGGRGGRLVRRTSHTAGTRTGPLLPARVSGACVPTWWAWMGTVTGE